MAASEAERWPFDPPYTVDDLPQLDRLHDLIRLGPEWLASESRQKLSASARADRIEAQP